MKTYEEMLKLADDNSRCNWNENSWKKVLNWLNETKKQIDKKTVLALCNNYDEFEDIAWTLGIIQ